MRDPALHSGEAGPALTPAAIPLRQATRVWARIALLSFGGPAGQIAVMHRILVEEERWIGEERFLHALSYCMMLPGPEAQQLATYIGWLMHRTKGGFVAGGLFVLPGFAAIMALSWFYVLFGKIDLVKGFFFGLKAAVLAIVLQALLRIARRAIRTRELVVLAALAFAGIFFLAVPFPVIVLAAGLYGLIRAKVSSASPRPHASVPEGAIADEDTMLGTAIPAHARDYRQAMRVSLALLVAWLAPVFLLVLLAGPANIFSKIATFFSTMAVVTFGGAYAVLAYVAQQAVSRFHWLSPGEMLDGLGMAETTPGPLIMVTQFVGFLAGYRSGGSLSPLLAASLGAVLTTWVTFVPCFLWIFAGAPFIERLRGNERLAAALAAITAAIVGVIANLAAWFALHFMFGRVEAHHLLARTFELPVLGSVSWPALAMSAAALSAAFLLRLSTPVLLLAVSFAAVGLKFAGVIT